MKVQTCQFHQLGRNNFQLYFSEAPPPESQSLCRCLGKVNQSFISIMQPVGYPYNRPFTVCPVGYFDIGTEREGIIGGRHFLVGKGPSISHPVPVKLIGIKTGHPVLDRMLIYFTMGRLMMDGRTGMMLRHHGENTYKYPQQQSTN